MNVALVLAGDPPDAEALALLAGSDRVVAADGGAAPLLQRGIIPELIVGDLDSLGEQRAKEAETKGAKVERHPRDKAKTDGELALDAVLRARPERIFIMGARGGRLAMELASLNLLETATQAAPEAMIVDGGETTRILRAPTTLDIDAHKGVPLDLVPWRHEARVGLEGTRWAGDDIRLAADEAMGVSNQIIAAHARVTVREGSVVCIVGRAITVEATT